MLESLPIFKAMNAKMAYLDKRQGVLAQNVANSDTPGYQPMDMKQIDFKSLLGRTDMKAAENADPVRMQRTSGTHLGAGGKTNVSAKEQRAVYEVAPTGNSVILEEQMMKISKNVMEYKTITGIYQKNLGMLRMVLRTE